MNHFANMLSMLDSVFPLDTRASLERPGLSTSTNTCMGDDECGTLAAGTTDSASRPAESITLSNGRVVTLEIVGWGPSGLMWSAADANDPSRAGWGESPSLAIDDLRSLLEHA